MVGSSPPQILLVGVSGQVGHELSRTLSAVGNVIAMDRGAMDLSAPESLRTVVRSHKPDVIVNAAAHTAVDRAESERDLAHTINAVAPGVLAEEAARLGAVFVHYS